MVSIPKGMLRAAMITWLAKRSRHASIANGEPARHSLT